MKRGYIQASKQEQNEGLQVDAFHIALTTCDNIFDAGGVGTSIVRIARGLATHYNTQVDIIMLNPGQHAGFNPRGRNGIIQPDQRIDNVTLYTLAPWTGGTSQAQHRVDIHYALLELAAERQYDLMQAFYVSITGFPIVSAARELNIPSVVSIRGNDIIRDVFHPERFSYLKSALESALLSILPLFNDALYSAWRADWIARPPPSAVRLGVSMRAQSRGPCGLMSCRRLYAPHLRVGEAGGPSAHVSR